MPKSHLSGIVTLYVGVGLAALATSLGFLVLSIRANLNYNYEKVEDNSGDNNEK